MRKGLTLALLSAALISLGGCGEAEQPVETDAQPAVSQAAPQGPLKFESVAAMIEDFGDYSAENGTFKQVTDAPLQIQLATTVAAGDLQENIDRELRRAALYGVYRTFIHTDTDAVKVRVVPNELAGSPPTLTVRERPNLEVTVTRAQALQAAQSLVQVEQLSDLVTPEQAGKIQLDNWRKDFEGVYFKDDGQEALLKAIQAAGGDVVNNG